MTNNEVMEYINEFNGEIRNMVVTISWLGQGVKGTPSPSKIGEYYECIAATSEAIDCDSNENLGFINIKWLGRKKGLFGYKYGYKFLLNHSYKIKLQHKSGKNEYYILDVLNEIKTPITNINSDKQEKEYKEKQIETIEYDDDRYGKVVFEHDLNNHTLSSEIENVTFAEDKLKLSILNIIDDINLKTLFDNLKKYSDNSKSIKERIYPELLFKLKNTDNYDKDGNIFKPTEQFLKDNFEFHSIVIEEPNIIQIWGSWESSGDQDYSINYNCDKDTIEIELL